MVSDDEWVVFQAKKPENMKDVRSKSFLAKATRIEILPKSQKLERIRSSDQCMRRMEPQKKRGQSISQKLMVHEDLQSDMSQLQQKLAEVLAQLNEQKMR